MNPKELANTSYTYESELSLLIKDMSLAEYKMADIVNKLSVLISRTELLELLDNITINNASMTSRTIMEWASVYNKLCSIGIPLKTICRAPLSRWMRVISIVNNENSERISYIIHDRGYTKLLKEIRLEKPSGRI